jgi:hydrogenase maturation protease
MKTLVLGLGNPVLSDDGVGIRIARRLEDRVDQREVTVMEASQAGLSILDLLAGYDRAIIVDAVQTVGGEAGQVHHFSPEVLDTARHAASPHDIDVGTALELGSRLGLPLPKQMVIFGVEAADVGTFSEECTAQVREAIPVCVEMIIEELNRHQDA